MDEIAAQEDDKLGNHSKHDSVAMCDKDESGFNDDISACSIEDKSITDNSMDTHESINHFVLEQCSINKTPDVLQNDKNVSFGGMMKDDSGIYSEKSPNTAHTKEISDGEWSESVGESLEEMKDFLNETGDCDDNSIDTSGIVTKVKNSDTIKNIETNNDETDAFKDNVNMEEENYGNENPVNAETVDIVTKCEAKLELSECDKSDFNAEQTESNMQQTSSGKCDSIGDANGDEGFADFVRSTIKTRSHVRKLVDYDTDDSDDDSSVGSPVLVRGHRRYRKRKTDSDSEENTSTNENKDSENISNEQNDETVPVLLRHSQLINENSPPNNVEISDLSSDSSETSHILPKVRLDSSSESEPEDTPPDVSEFGPPKNKWRALFDLRHREFGYSTVDDPGYFRKHVQGSLQMVKRFDLQFKMDSHEGCVNALHFSKIGTLLASGSDDLNIVIWNWSRNRPALIYDSGHRSNVFQAKFMPFSGDCHVVSCARDGQVRLADLSSTGVCKGTKKIAQHKGAAHKLALEMDSPHIVLSAGEDAVTYEIDLRADKPNKLVTTKENDKKISIYSIHSNPVNSNEFCLGGRDHFIRIYDKRKINEEVNNGLLKKFAPHHIVETGNSNVKANVTCACYNYNGSEVLGTYNDEDIYLFSNEHSDNANYIHRYRGHRNNQTVKGVNFYGPRSEFIVSGSDCGHIFLWDKSTENIVQYMEGDEGGVINVLEPHPFAPVLATSGLDHDVKIWAPTAENPTTLKGLKKLIKRNCREREEEGRSDGGMIDGSMLWFIMHHLRRGRRQRAREARAAHGQPAHDLETSDTLSDEDLTTDEDSDNEGGGSRDAMSCNPS